MTYATGILIAVCSILVGMSVGLLAAVMIWKTRYRTALEIIKLLKERITEESQP